jgi:uncharacterized membrane protein YcaP (DUF421 family)
VATALALLIFLQFVVSFGRYGRRAARESFAPSPHCWRWPICGDAMKKERVTEDEALSAIRSAGGSDVADVASLVLESDGTISATLQTGTDKPPL